VAWALIKILVLALIHNEDFRAKKTYSLVGWGLQTVLSHESFGSNDSRRLYDERPVGRNSRRTADVSRLSAGFRAKKTSVDPPDPTSVSDRHGKQTDTQPMPSALSVVRGNECKIIVNEKKF